MFRLLIEALFADRVQELNAIIRHLDENRASQRPHWWSPLFTSLPVIDDWHYPVDRP